jgi:hypothetical protein
MARPLCRAYINRISDIAEDGPGWSCKLLMVEQQGTPDR